MAWHFCIENPNIQYNFYYGVPHAHTSYSDGSGTPSEAYDIPDRRRMTIEELHDWLCTEDRVIVSVNNPRRTAETLTYSNEMDDFIKLIEVGNGSPPHKYRRSENSYFKVLDNGWHNGPIFSYICTITTESIKIRYDKLELINNLSFHVLEIFLYR